MTPEEPADYAVASVGIHSAVTADDIDGGFSDEDIETWMETGVNPIDSATEQDDEKS